MCACMMVWPAAGLADVAALPVGEPETEVLVAEGPQHVDVGQAHVAGHEQGLADGLQEFVPIGVIAGAALDEHRLLDAVVGQVVQQIRGEIGGAGELPQVVVGVNQRSFGIDCGLADLVEPLVIYGRQCGAPFAVVVTRWLCLCARKSILGWLRTGLFGVAGLDPRPNPGV